MSLINLEEDYVKKRKFTLRIAPNLFNHYPEDFEKIIGKTNFIHNRRFKPKTIILDLSLTLDKNCRDCNYGWRHELSKVERCDLKVITDTIS